MTKKRIKRAIAILVSVMMTMTCMVAPSFAAEKDSQLIVKGVPEGATVTAYQVMVEGNGKWVMKSGVTPASTMDTANPTIPAPTAEQVQAWAKAAVAGDYGKGDGLDWVAANSDYESEADALNPGLYVVVINGGDDKIYSPLILGVDYADDNDSSQLTLDLTSKFNGTGYAKVTEPSVDKQIRNADKEFVTGSDKGHQSGDAAGKGDQVDYRVVTQIPSYTTEYTSPRFFVSDELLTGLDSYVGDIVVYEGSATAGNELEFGRDWWFVKDDTTSKYVKDDAAAASTAKVGQKTFRIEIKAASGQDARDIIVDYSAKIDPNCQTGFKPNQNEATIEYTHKTGNENDFKEKKDRTNHYSFNIDQYLEGYETSKEKGTSEIVKVDEDGNATVISSETWESQTRTQNHPLAGAVFALKQGDTIIRYAISNDEGKLVESTEKYKDEAGEEHAIEGLTKLDAGTYTLVEVQAPEGYALLPESSAVTIQIKAEVNDDGSLKSYTIEVGNAKTVYTKDNGTITRTGSQTDNTGATTPIKNQKVGALPSTGGVGTVGLTIAGILIMALAAGLYFRSRRKAHAQQ